MVNWMLIFFCSCVCLCDIDNDSLWHHILLFKSINFNSFRSIMANDSIHSIKFMNDSILFKCIWFICHGIIYFVYKLIFRISELAWMINKIDAHRVYYGLSTSEFPANNTMRNIFLAAQSKKGRKADRVKRSRAHCRCFVSVNCFYFGSVLLFLSLVLLLLPFENVCLSPFAI